jgi:hypothetical protein
MIFGTIAHYELRTTVYFIAVFLALIMTLCSGFSVLVENVIGVILKTVL